MRKTATSGVRRVGDLPVAVASDIGNIRSENQDRAAIVRFNGRSQTSLLLVLCDGMGGMRDGSFCASVAISTFILSYIRESRLPPQDRMMMAAYKANDAVYSEYDGAGGATLSALMVNNPNVAWWVNVGDSRIYSSQKNKIEQITTDDTIAAHARRNDPSRGSNEILQFIGMGSELEPHCTKLMLSHGQLLLTSDGAHYIGEDILHSLLTNASDPATAVKRITELAKWCGGRDNATAIALGDTAGTLGLSDEDSLGVIEVWDAFGEIQFVTDGLPPIAPFDRRPDKPEPNTGLRLKPAQPEPRKPAEPSNTPKRPQNKRGRGGKGKAAGTAIDKTPNTNGANEPPRPQLKIEFNGPDSEEDD